MPIITHKIQLELNWIEDCILSSAGNSAKFEITGAKLQVLIVTLSTKDNLNLLKIVLIMTKQLSDGFKRSVYWNSYQIIPAKVIEKVKSIFELLSALFQSLKRLSVLAYFIAADAANNEAGIKNNRKYFLPRGEIKNYNVFIDRRNFYGQPIDDLL